jgi:hypothetical protein
MRSRLVRLRVTVMAVLLAASIALGGFVNATTPFTFAATPEAGGMCEHATAPSPTRHTHCSEGCCKVACACAFTHAIGFVPLPWLAIAPVRTPLPTLAGTAASAGSAMPQLRPPIV